MRISFFKIKKTANLVDFRVEICPGRLVATLHCVFREQATAKLAGKYREHHACRQFWS